jgi:hypothetical protein
MEVSGMLISYGNEVKFKDFEWNYRITRDFKLKNYDKLRYPKLVFLVRYCRIINKLTALNFVLEIVNLSRIVRNSPLLMILQILTKINRF